MSAKCAFDVTAVLLFVCGLAATVLLLDRLRRGGEEQPEQEDKDEEDSCYKRV